jgi:acyl-CoA synthetase (NDP forming)
MSCFLGRQGVPERLRSMKKAHIPSYAFPETAVRVLARAVRYGEWLRRAPGREVVLDGIDREATRSALAAARRRLGAEGGWLNPEEIEGVLTPYGITVNRSRFAADAGAAVRAAEEIGYPVVAKLDSSLTHKSDVGGVKLDLRDAGEVREAFEAIRAALADRGLEKEMRGVTMAAMIPEGVEIIAGATQDPLFGPLVMFGLGGVHVELMKDVALRIHPLTDDDATAMVQEVKGYPLLTGYRGTPPSDIPAVEDLLQRISTLAGDHPELEEMDLNPVKVRPAGGGLVAVDARILLGGLAG